MEINPVKGTHDIIEDEANLYSSIEYNASMLAAFFGFKEIRTPIIEHTPLYLRSVGEDSDIVTKEMYTFLDKGNRSLTLRPELTAGVMRSIVSNKLYATNDLPLKYFYHGPCFRYERPQNGRYRQFSQFGVELVGATSPSQDAEVILLGQRLLDTLGLQNVKIHINSLGDDLSRVNYKKALKDYFKDHIKDMCADCQRRFDTNPLRILDCKIPEDREIIKGAPKMSDYLSDEARDYFDSVIDLLKSVGIEPIVDDGLVRGLDYYTGVVFEYVLEDGSIGAIGGGGHYKNLLKELGGPDLEGVGLSFGIERLVYVFSKVHNKTGLSFGPDLYLMGMSPAIIESNFSLCDILRTSGFSVEMNYEVKSFKSLFKIADRKHAKFALIIGDDELKNKQVTVKNLLTQEQSQVSMEDLIKVLPSMLDDYMNELQKREENLE